MKKILTLMALLIILIIILVAFSNIFTNTKNMNTNQPQEYTLKTSKQVDIINTTGESLKITLDSVDAPVNSAPGSRPFYHLTVTKDTQSKQVLFDSNESGQFFTYFGVTVKISMVVNSNDLVIIPVKTMGKNLIVSKSLSGENPNITTKIGTITFDTTNHATLSIEKTDGVAAEMTEDVAGLTAAWSDISKTPELVWKYNNIIGEERLIAGDTSRPGDENYIYAVKSTLERKYGFSVDIVE